MGFARNNKQLKLALVFFISCIYASSFANEDELEVGGLVIDNTITIKARQFYLLFAKSWAPVKPLQKYNITIKEKPSARWGSQLTIISQGTTLYSMALQRNGRGLSEQVNYAIRVVNNALLNRHYLHSSHNPDLSDNGY